LAGAQQQGTDLLIGISKLLPSRKIVAFMTVGYVSGSHQIRHAESCTEPGMRDTPFVSKFSDKEKSFIENNWDDLKTLPWASEKSANAKVVMDGQIIFGRKEAPNFSSVVNWAKIPELSKVWNEYLKFELAGSSKSYNSLYNLTQLIGQPEYKKWTIVGEYGEQKNLPPWANKKTMLQAVEEAKKKSKLGHSTR
jgi:hypothetical protein